LNAAVEERYRYGLSVRDFDERRSRVNTALRNALGARGAAPYLIEGEGRPKVYRLGLAAQAIAIRED
jgi:hypothetical protein